jgi:hypothetical protein
LKEGGDGPPLGASSKSRSPNPEGGKEETSPWPRLSGPDGTACPGLSRKMPPIGGAGRFSVPAPRPSRQAFRAEHDQVLVKAGSQPIEPPGDRERMDRASDGRGSLWYSFRTPFILCSTRSTTSPMGALPPSSANASRMGRRKASSGVRGPRGSRHRYIVFAVPIGTQRRWKFSTKSSATSRIRFSAPTSASSEAHLLRRKRGAGYRAGGAPSAASLESKGLAKP